jgi:hypothetical protein
MSLVIAYSDPGGLENPVTNVAITDHIGWGTVGLAMSAAFGNPDMSTIEIEDPLGIYDFQGLRALYVNETSAPSNNRVIGQFVIQDRNVGRDAGRALLTAQGRLWSLDVTDYNWHLGKRILHDADANRPVETAGDRLRWLLHHADGVSLYDYGHVRYPTAQVDAVDFRGQRVIDVLADCAIEEQFNFFCDYNEAHGRPELFFYNPNTTFIAYEASIGISNVMTEVDTGGGLVFYPYRDGKLRRSPARIAYGVHLPYANGYVYVRRDSTGAAFAKLDQAAPMANVKSEARARRIANRFLDDHDEETDIIECAIKVPRALVNAVRQGQTIPARFQHLPGYEDTTLLRVVKRTVSQEQELGDTHYLIGLELSPLSPPVSGTLPEPTPAPGTTSGGILYQPGRTGPPNTSFNIFWGSTGDNPGIGYGIRPRDATNFDYIDAVPTVGGWEILHNSTLDIAMQLSIADATGSPRTFNVQMRQNGSVIASDSYTGTGFVGHFFNLNVSDLVCTAGDLLTVTMTTSELSGLSVPWGVGDLSNRFEILTTSTIG